MFHRPTVAELTAMALEFAIPDIGRDVTETKSPAAEVKAASPRSDESKSAGSASDSDVDSDPLYYVDRHHPERFFNKFGVVYMEEKQTDYTQGKKLAVAPVALLKEALKSEKPCYGLYTMVAIKKGDYILEYVGEKISAAAYNKLPLEEKHYGICIPEDNESDDPKYYVNATQKGNAARFANHSLAPNVCYEEHEGKIYLTALEDIPKGAQLVADYGRFFPLTKTIHIQAHHNWKKFDEVYEENKAQYFDEKNAPSFVVSEVRTLLALKEEETLLIPSAVIKPIIGNIDPNLPVLVKNSKTNKILESQVELTPLMIACYMGNDEKVFELIKCGVDQNRYTRDLKTALHYILQSANVEREKKKIIIHKLKTSPFISKHETIYHDCAELNLLKYIEFLPKFSHEGIGSSPIIFALQQRRVSLAVKLLKNTNLQEFYGHLFYQNKLTDQGESFKVLFCELDNKGKKKFNDAIMELGAACKSDAFYTKIQILFLEFTSASEKKADRQTQSAAALFSGGPSGVKRKTSPSEEKGNGSGKKAKLG